MGDLLIALDATEDASLKSLLGALARLILTKAGGLHCCVVVVISWLSSGSLLRNSDSLVAILPSEGLSCRFDPCPLDRTLVHLVLKIVLVVIMGSHHSFRGRRKGE